MKTLCPYIKTKLLLATTVLLVAFVSCKKDSIETTTQAPVQSSDVTKPTDSVSYTLDGTTYTCNVITGEGGGIAGANLETANGGWKWDADTLQYRKDYTYGVSSSFTGGNGGRLTIHFAKKFAKAQLTRAVAPGILGPVSDTLLYYPRGGYPYAVDFDRFNSQNGIVLKLVGTVNGGNGTQLLSTYSVQMVRLPTTITNDSQKDSKFEITNISFVSAYQGWWNCHLLEAKFSASVFDSSEKPHHVDGYIRIHVN
jgi:hypothetical protein